MLSLFIPECMWNEFWVKEYLNNKKNHLRATVIKITLVFFFFFFRHFITTTFNFTVKEQEWFKLSVVCLSF